ncbi:cytochrome c family protein [Desulfobacterota bacterium AH_259_B03_O07]|nr:cytochrome c family protein [Desulfobacterota bacterium AH_259_B03_O07]
MINKKIKNFISIISLITSFLILLLIFQIPISKGDIVRPKPKKKVTGIKFMSPGTCASSNCHGAAAPRNRPGLDINQNEFTIWFTKDSHRKAFDVLLNQESNQIAKNLRLQDPPEESEECLVCHTTYAPASLWGKEFDFSDGVSCESCHGPSEKWLGPHTASDWTTEKSVELGMYDTKNIFSRANICLGCHIGDETKTVDHEMIAAGHPDLNRFELDTFIAFMPPHWRKPQKTDENLWAGTEIWSIGQATTLKQSMEQLARRAGSKTWHAWPEFAEFNCYSCHHDLKDDSWRQAVGYDGRTPGIPPWNSARYVLLRPLASEISPDLSNQLDKEISTLSGLLNRIGSGNPAQISSTATKVAEIIDSLETQMQGLQVDENLTYDLMLKISADGQYIANSGIRSAQQAAVALETLFYNYNQNVKGQSNQQISDAISKLFDYLEEPEKYNPATFASKIRNINQLLRSNAQ